ncbi:hypothetical protein CR105_16055 [Massilia eurypsychrophila]|uniref:Uncharacterized protein n=1 Tax=Massilia eurypsychrophila TaxID=1485217 RepID=A0A2G8TCS9_9BURK|nr:hypothetical protein CR105_16055 [Massilia eurypsychrophila]
MSGLERNVPLTEIVRSATAAAESGALAICPYARGSAAAWCWMHMFSAALAAATIEIMEAA